MSEPGLRQALDQAHARAVEAARRTRDVHSPQRQLAWYSVFEESLRVAGLARALGDEARSGEALEDAAAAAAATFASQDTVPSPREDLVVDTSMTNPWVWVHGLQAAIASGRRDAEEDLLRTPAERLASDQVVASPGLTAFASGLRALLTEEQEGARADLAAVPEDEPYYAAQARALTAMLDGRAPDLDAVAVAVDAAYAVPELEHEPERYLRLPVLALHALATRRLGPGASP